ncbi:MAG: PKD domain-containing protein [Chloroflexi bacterium]|nr:PKD domain-containing protein [Chloroflexota bacterium]
MAESRVSPLSKNQIVCEAEDIDEDELAYWWLANGGTIEGQGPVVNWTAPETPGEYTIAVFVNDNQGGTATQSVTITVTDKPNQPPIITSLIVTIARPVEQIEIDPSVEQLDRPPIVVRTLTPAVIVCVAEDPDDDNLTYTWTATDGKITDEEGRKVVWIAPTNPIRHFVTVEVNDGRGGSSSAKIAFDVSCCK